MTAQVGSPTKDVSRVEVNMDTTNWKWATDLKFPFNIDEMIDYCVGTIPGSSGGIFGIDTTQGKTNLTFAGVTGSGPGPRAPLRVNLPIVANPKSIVTTLDEDGFTNVLIGGDGILHIASQNCVDSVPGGTVYPATLTDRALWGTRRLEVAQSGRTIALWAINGGNHLVAQSAQLKLNEDEGYDELFSTDIPVPLLAGGNQLQTYDAVIQPQTQSQQVFCLKEDGSVSSLHQPGDSKMWSEQSLRIPDPDDVQDINTYSCHITLKDANGHALPEADIQLATSSQVTCVVNGKRVPLGTSAVKSKSDSQGVVSLILPAPDLSAPNITVTGPDSHSFSFNPAVKAINKLIDIAKSGKLGEVRDQSGGQLFKKADKALTDAIVHLGQTYMQKTSTDSLQSAATAISVHLATSPDTGGLLWRFLHGVISGLEEILGFAYEAGDFIIRTAKKAWRFTVNTAEQALKALSGLMTIVETAVEDALIWLAEKLDWEGIKDTVTIFNELVNTSIDAVQELMVGGSDTLDMIFELVETEVTSWHLPPVLPDEIASRKPNIEQANKSNSNEFSDSPCFNWVGTQLENGESKKRMSDAASAADDNNFLDTLKNIYNNILRQLWDNLGDALSAIWKDLTQLFNDNSTMTWGDIFKNLGVDALLGIIRGVRKAVRGIVAVSSSFLMWLKNLLNKPLNIWVVSKVYKRVTGGEELTMLSLCALMLAVPTNWVFKKLYGRKPGEVPQIAKLLKEIRSRPKRETPAGSTVALARQSQMMAFTSFVGGTAHSEKADGSKPTPTVSKERAPFSIDALLKSNVTRSTEVELLLYTWRLATLMKGPGKVVYTLIDTIRTGLSWKTAGPEAGNPDETKWALGPRVYFTIVMTVASFPFNKLGRGATGGFARIVACVVTGVLNIIKAGVPKIARFGLGCMAGQIDMLFYGIALVAEAANSEETDGAVEASHRLLTDSWAIGSAMNAVTKGAEPYTLAITGVIALGVNVEGGLLIYQQRDYYSKRLDDENWDFRDTVSNSLNASV